MASWTDLKLSTAQVNNLVQVDVEQIIVAFIFLYLQIKVAFVAGVAVIVIMIPLNALVAQRIGTNTALLMVEKDARIKVVSEAFRNICSLKMSGLEGCVVQASNARRVQEVRYLAVRKYLDAVCVLLWASMPVVVPFVTFTTVVMNDTQRLTASDVITSIALLNMLIFPMNARVSARRLAHVLLAEDGSQLVLTNDQLDDDHTSSGGLSSTSLAATLQEDFHSPAARYSWTKKPNDVKDISLFAGRDIESQDVSEEAMLFPLHRGDETQQSDFQVEVGDLVGKVGEMWVVVGSTGSGKTALLLGLLGEMHSGNSSTITEFRDASVSSLRSRVESQEGLGLSPIGGGGGGGGGGGAKSGAYESKSRKRIAYCAQVPPMHSGSVRSNIVMGDAFDAARYRDVLRGCCLGPDLVGSNWTAGDLSDVGAAGSNLSGGQRLRIGIARALYSQHAVVVLDDPFSALDAATGSLMMKYLAERVCGQQKRVVILSTHSLALLQPSHSSTNVAGIIVLQHDKEVDRGTYAELQTSSAYFRDLSEHFAAQPVSDSNTATSGHQQFDVTSESLTAQELEMVLDSCIRRQQSGSVDASDLDACTMIALKALREHDKAAAEDVERAGGGPDVLKQEELPTLLQNIEQMASGRIHSSVYRSYLSAVGVCLTVSIVLSTLLMYATSIAMSLWLAYWATRQDEFSKSDFVWISTAIVVSNLVFALFRSFLFAKGGLNAAVHLYDRLSVAVFRAKISFFEETSVGRLTNRFGKDTNVIDDQLPFIMNSLLAQLFMILGGTFVMAYNDPLIIVLLLLVAVVHYRLQKFYRESSRELRRLDSVYRSPVYTIFAECMQNAVSIRALGTTCVRYFDKQLSQSVDNSLRVSLSINIASQWLGVRLQLLGALVNTVLAAMIVVNALYDILPVSAGLAGLSLIYSFSIVNNLNGLVNAFAETEQEMISVERVLEYCALESEFAADGPEDDEDAPVLSSDRRLPSAGYKRYDRDNTYYVTPSSDQMSGTSVSDELLYGLVAKSAGHSAKKGNLLKSGGILLSDVCMRYETNALDTLRHISLHIAPGSRVAVVGRTGSGKSSLMRVLLRLNEYHSGSVSLGGVELNQQSKRQLRRRIGVIPQTPLVFSGSVRFNLDPYGTYSDEQVLDALQRSRLFETTLASSSHSIDRGAERIDGLADLMRFELVDGGSNLSLGQRQLLCLGRVLLRRCELVLVDEATAAIDPVTEAILYEVLAEQLQTLGSTLVMICHKQNGVHKLCDKMLEIRDGQVLSYEDILQSADM
eukprot:gene22151-28258_t